MVEGRGILTSAPGLVPPGWCWQAGISYRCLASALTEHWANTVNGDLCSVERRSLYRRMLRQRSTEKQARERERDKETERESGEDSSPSEYF